MKKTAYLLATLSLVLGSLHAQTVPLLLNYQGRVTDSGGTGLGTPTPVNRKIVFRIWDTPSSGGAALSAPNASPNRLWTEEQTVTIASGDFSVLLGQGIAATGGIAGESRPALDTVFTSSGVSRFLEVIVDNGDGAINGSDSPISPRQQLTSTAYAFRARAADTIAGASDLTINPTAAAISGGSVPANYGLGWYGTARTFNGTAINGPVLYGFDGGALGSVNGATQVNALRWNASGQVGIGSSTLAGAAGTNKLILQGNDTTATPQQLLIRGDTDTNRQLLIGYNTTSDYGSIQAKNSGVNFTPLVLNPSGGNVGIGTTTPGARLQIDSLGNALPATSGSTQSVGLIARLKSSGSSDAGLDIGSADTGGFWLQSANRATLNVNYSLLLNPNGGNVGIGTTSPTRKLLVESDGFGISHKNGTKELGTYMDSNTGNPCLIGTVSNNTLGFFTNNSSARMSIDTNGNVGIGTTSLAAKLHIKAASDNSGGAGIKLEHAGDTSGWFIWPENAGDNLIFMFNGQYPSGVYTLLSKNSSGFITVSDERIKKDIEVINGSLERVMKLRPKTYRFKSAAADTPLNYGFIAQEVEKVYPDLVGENRGQKTLAINSLISINTQAIQELKKEKDAEVKLLRQENEAIKAALAEQTKQLAEFKAKDKARDAKLAAIEKLLLAGEKAEVQPVSLKKSAGGAE